MSRALLFLAAVVLVTDVACGARLNLEKLRQETDRVASLEEYRRTHAEVFALDERGFLDFQKIVDWAKKQSVDIMQSVKSQTLETFQEVKSDVANKMTNFETVLGETRVECAKVVQNLKGQLAEGLQSLASPAKGEVPKVLATMDGLKVKLGEARDALTAQLLAGSMSGASDVLQQHLAILWTEAKRTADGPLKDQLLASAEVLKGELGRVLDKVTDSSKEQFTQVFSSSFNRAENLVHQLIAEVESTLKEGGAKLAGKVGNDLQASANDFAAGLKRGDFAPAAASLLQFSRHMVDGNFLAAQLEKLRQAAKNLADAAVQAASAQAEKIIDSVSGVAKQIGEAATAAIDKQLVPKLEELKGKGLVWLREQLTAARKAALDGANNAVAKLTTMNGFAGAQAKALLDQYGPAADQWAKDLTDRSVEMLDANTNIEKARDALKAALDEKLLEAAGQLQAYLRDAKGDLEVELRKKLAQVEAELWDKRTVAYKAQKDAAAALEALAAKAAEALGRMKVDVQKETDPVKATMLMAGLSIADDFAKQLKDVAKQYGQEAQVSLDDAANGLGTAALGR